MILLTITMTSLCFISAQCVANLKYYETFNNVDVSSRVRRSAEGISELIKEVKFKAFNRDFHVVVKSGATVLAKGFKARLVHGDGRSTLFNVDQSRIYTGHISGHPEVIVHAHMEDMLWSMQIFEKKDIYAIEPAENLLNATENPRNDTMIAYRGSDHFSNGHSFCGGVKRTESESQIYLPLVPDASDAQNLTSGIQHGGTRKKRGTENTCTLQVVADYLFFAKRCRGNPLACTSLLINFVHTADHIFRSSKFEDNQFKIHRDIGLQLAELMLFTTFTSTEDGTGQVHFNSPHIKWTADSKLTAFAHYNGQISRSKRFCLNHLFTSYRMPDHVLGYAYLNNICTLVPNADGLLYNTGITSGEDIGLGPVPSLQVNLVFAHGHNFGSEHDPLTDECAADDHDGGKFLMWYISVTGILPNNKIFSPCSRKQIGRSISSARCLLRRSKLTPFCGNGIVDEGEECDAGSIGISGFDSCCTRACKYKPGAVCSPVNQPCCTNCKMAKARVPCIDIKMSNCKSASYCTGRSYDCPTPKNLPDFTSCTDGGQCYNGICEGFCFIKSIKENIKLEPCLCNSNTTAACKWCCYDNTDEKNPGPCRPRSNKILKDGRPCYSGYCKNGLCKVNVVSTVNRVYSYLQRIEVSGLVKFMKTNIVLSVFVFSLILWIPPSCMIYRIDSLERMEREQEEALMRALSYTSRMGDLEARRSVASTGSGAASGTRHSKTDSESSLGDDNSTSLKSDVDPIMTRHSRRHGPEQDAASLPEVSVQDVTPGYSSRPDPVPRVTFLDTARRESEI